MANRYGFSLNLGSLVYVEAATERQARAKLSTIQNHTGFSVPEAEIDVTEVSFTEHPSLALLVKINGEDLGVSSRYGEAINQALGNWTAKPTDILTVFRWEGANMPAFLEWAYAEDGSVGQVGDVLTIGKLRLPPGSHIARFGDGHIGLVQETKFA